MNAPQAAATMEPKSEEKDEINQYKDSELKESKHEDEDIAPPKLLPHTVPNQILTHGLRPAHRVCNSLCSPNEIKVTGREPTEYFDAPPHLYVEE